MTDADRMTAVYLDVQALFARFYGDKPLELAAKRALRALKKGDTSKLDETARVVLLSCAEGITMVPELPADVEESRRVRALLGLDKEGEAA